MACPYNDDACAHGICTHPGCREERQLNTDYKIGDRVRITRTWEGTVTDIGPAPSIKLDGTLSFMIPDHGGSTTTVEVIEPAYEAGVVYLDSNDKAFVRRDDSDEPWRDRIDGTWEEEYPVRPLRKFIAEPDLG